MSGETNHQDTYKNSPRPDSVEIGLQFQDYVADCLRREMAMLIQNYGSKRYQYARGENPQGVEIKLDTRCAGPHDQGRPPTHRLSIEVAEKTEHARDWVPSGISGKSTFYAQGNMSCFWLFSTRYLRMYREAKNPKTEQFNGTVEKFYLPIEVADKWCLAKFQDGKRVM